MPEDCCVACPQLSLTWSQGRIVNMAANSLHKAEATAADAGNHPLWCHTMNNVTQQAPWVCRVWQNLV